MPTIEMSNGQTHTVTDPSTAAGTVRRIEAAAEEKKFARVKDQDGDMVGVNPINVSSVY